jgi:toxin ParE1/3/4
MNFRILLTVAAKSDLRDIFRYVEMHDSPERADGLLGALEQVTTSLAEMTERGHYPPELERIGVRDFQQLCFKSYRIIYSLHADEVVVHAVLDGRRDMQTLLQQRLLQ